MTLMYFFAGAFFGVIGMLAFAVWLVERDWME